MLCVVLLLALVTSQAYANSCTPGGECQQAFSLPPMPYPKDALEPVISAETVDFHYGKHHAGYVNKLNALAKEQEELKSHTLESIITSMPKGSKVFNLAAQIWNHNLFWEGMKPYSAENTATPSEDSTIGQFITRDFGSFEAFQKKFSDLAANHFGSGWVWLVQNDEGTLLCLDSHDAANPMADGYHPIITLDVWEHSYYIQYRHDRATYIKSWWSIVNWSYAEHRLRK